MVFLSRVLLKPPRAFSIPRFIIPRDTRHSFCVIPCHSGSLARANLSQLGLLDTSEPAQLGITTNRIDYPNRQPEYHQPEQRTLRSAGIFYCLSPLSVPRPSLAASAK